MKEHALLQPGQASTRESRVKTNGAALHRTKENGNIQAKSFLFTTLVHKTHQPCARSSACIQSCARHINATKRLFGFTHQSRRWPCFCTHPRIPAPLVQSPQMCAQYALLLLLLICRAVAQTNLFPMGDLWSYNDKNVDLSKVVPAWFTYFYDDSTWTSGYGGFGNGNAVVQTTTASGSATNRIITYYFRKVCEPA